MNHRENLLSLLRRQGYAQVPIDLNPCPAIRERLDAWIREHPEQQAQGYFDLPWQNAGGHILQPEDTARFHPYHQKADLGDPNVHIDFMGVGHRRTASSMHMSKMLHPLAQVDSVEQIQAYPLGHYASPENLQRVSRNVADLHAKGLAARSMQSLAVWEHAWYLRGMENLMVDMMSDDPMATALLDKVTGIALEQVELYVSAGVDILLLGDDVGMQKSIMMSESMFCEWLKPRLYKLIQAAKRLNPSLVVIFHSCGYIEPFIPHLIEIGVDVLNPVQPECMDFEKLHEAYGDRLSFFGTIGTQTTLPFGTPETVRQTVERNLRIVGDQGGLFPAPTHMLEPEVPLENILAYIDACRRFRG